MIKKLLVGTIKREYFSKILLKISQNLHIDLMKKKFQNVSSGLNMARNMSAETNVSKTDNTKVSSSYQTRMGDRHKDKEKVQKLMKLLEQYKEDKKVMETENDILKKKLKRVPNFVIIQINNCS